MDSSAERDYSAQRSNEEGGSSGNRDVPIGTSLWTTTNALDHQATMTNPPGNVSSTVRQSEDHLPLGATAWKLGHDLIDEHEYGRAAECFRRVLLSAGTSAERLSIEAAEAAVQLCAALSQERLVGEKLQDIRKILGQNLSELSYEEISFVRGTLAACEQARSPATHHTSSTIAEGGPTGATAGRALPSAEAPTPGSWALSSNRSKATAVALASQSCLRIRFFGRFELLRDGEEVVFLGRNGRALAILKYLLAHREDRPVPQDYLMGWLWPESDSKRARWSLNSAIYVLRKLLGDCVPSLPTSEIVLFEGGGYRLSPRVLLSADTDEFDVHYEEGRHLEEASRLPEAMAEYEKAAELYRGDYLSEDLYEDWTMIERERLVDAYTDLSRRLAVRYMEGGRLRKSVRTCYRILEKDRCDEDTHRLLMECYVRLGQRARALRQYRLCEQVLRCECDMIPSPETRALYACVLKDGGHH